MSVKEIRRRRMSSQVMLEAWRLKRSTVLYEFTFGTSLRMAWQVMRGKLRRCFTKVVGVTYETRQKLLERLLRYSSRQVVLKLVRQPDNPYDEFATLVYAEVKGRGAAAIGYLSSQLAAVLAPIMDSGRDVIVNEFDITGGGNKLYGCNISYIIA